MLACTTYILVNAMLSFIVELSRMTWFGCTCFVLIQYLIFSDPNKFIFK